MLLRSGRKLLEIARRRLIMRQTVITTILVQVADLQCFYVWFTDEYCKHNQNYHKSGFELANVKCNGGNSFNPYFDGYKSYFSYSFVGNSFIDRYWACNVDTAKPREPVVSDRTNPLLGEGCASASALNLPFSQQLNQGINRNYPYGMRTTLMHGLHIYIWELSNEEFYCERWE
jgi:hypothetical protein